VDWPHSPPRDGIPNGAHIVSGGDEAGDRPAYLELPNRTIDLLPRPPGSLDQWNFGYSGGGPGALATAICRTFELADCIDHDRLPIAWVEHQVSHCDRQLLRIPVTEIRSRYRQL